MMIFERRYRVSFGLDITLQQLDRLVAVARPLHYPDLVTPTSAVLACAAAKLAAAAVSGLNILISPQLEDNCTFILFNPKEFFCNADFG